MAATKPEVRVVLVIYREPIEIFRKFQRLLLIFSTMPSSKKKVPTSYPKFSTPEMQMTATKSEVSVVLVISLKPIDIQEIPNFDLGIFRNIGVAVGIFGISRRSGDVVSNAFTSGKMAAISISGTDESVYKVGIKFIDSGILENIGVVAGIFGISLYVLEISLVMH